MILKHDAYTLEKPTCYEILAEYLYFNMAQPAFGLYLVRNFDWILENTDGLISQGTNKVISYVTPVTIAF